MLDHIGLRSIGHLLTLLSMDISFHHVHVLFNGITGRIEIFFFNVKYQVENGNFFDHTYCEISDFGGKGH